jgi:hypothetical protein
LKGAIRGIVEAIVPACLTVRGPTTRDLPPALHPLRPCQRREGRGFELCVVCRLFGALGYQGRVRFADAPLVEGQTTLALAPPLHAPRPRGGAAPGRKFYRHGRPAHGTVPLEVCPAGARFRWRLDFANLRPDELGLLLLALGQGEPPLRLKLGGYKPACFGSVEFAAASLTLDDPASRWLQYEPAPPAEPERWDGERAAAGPDLAAYVQAATESGLVLRDRQERLAGILRYPSGRDCPGEGY